MKLAAQHLAQHFGPRLYRASQWLLAPGSTQQLGAQLVALLEGWRPTGAVIDVGCADASLLDALGFAPVGIERSYDRARAFGRAVQADAAQLPIRSGSVGLSFCCGLLHHLPERDVCSALTEMHRVLAAGGRLLVFDAVLPRRRWRQPLAMSIRALDRGAYQRSEESLSALLHTALPQLAWRIERAAYTATGLEGLWCMAEARPTCP